jgi:DNA gyrase/topoisomerase IV, subunit A/C-terminal associated domain of TOPRIM
MLSIIISYGFLNKEINGYLFLIALILVSDLVVFDVCVQPGTYLDQSEKLIKYSDFVNKELILFSMADLQRSIPSMVDGLKPGQRKILFCSFKRNFVKEAKV